MSVRQLVRITVAGFTIAWSSEGLVAVESAGNAAVQTAPAELAAAPNIVLILADDLDTHVAAQLPNVRRLQAMGVTFKNSFVANSL